jgi:hypothetical protein
MQVDNRGRSATTIPVRGKLCLVLATALAVLSGCGSATYEDRLQQTRDLYEYLHLVETHLASPAWNRSEFGLAMRVPKPFGRPMEGPEVTIDEDENEIRGPDPRHPDILGIDLPGLIEGWSAELPGDDESPVAARFYVMSNHERFLTRDDGGLPPDEFHADLERLLMNAFQVAIPDGEAARPADNARFRHQVPARGSQHARYTTPKDYIAIRFVPNEPIGGESLQGLLYQRREGNVQAAILILAPTSLSATFRQRIDLALQTFQVSPETPQRAAPGPDGQRRPAARDPGF